MATRQNEAGTRSSRQAAAGPQQPPSKRSAFSWGSGNAGVLAGAALAGAAIGIAANFGRKLFVQMPTRRDGRLVRRAQGRAPGDPRPVRQDRGDRRQPDDDARAICSRSSNMRSTKHAHRGGERDLPGASPGQPRPRRRRAQLRARLCEDLSLRARDACPRTAPTGSPASATSARCSRSISGWRRTRSSRAFRAGADRRRRMRSSPA